MLLISLILAGLGAFQLASAENVENSALKFGQVLQLQCLQRDEDGEVFNCPICRNMTELYRS